MSERNGLGALALFGGAPAVPGGPVLEHPFGHDLTAEIDDLFRSRPLSTLFGEHDVARFEAAFARRLNVGGAVAVNSGTSALHATLVALGIGRGDEVAVTCFSFVATASVIVQAGATPLWIDIDKDTLGLDPADLDAKITPRTRAVIAAHLFGIPCAIQQIASICADRGIPLIEDACQALGATVGGRAIGTFGTVGCFSFNVNKVIQTGEGGMLVSNDDRVLGIARELRVNGLSPFGYERLGFNYTLPNLQALIGLYQLERLDGILRRRTRYADRLSDALAVYAPVFPESRLSVVRCPYAVPFVAPVQTRAGRDLTVAALSREGVPVSGVYEILYKLEVVFGDSTQPPCREAERLIPRLLSISPSHRYDERSIDCFVHAIDKVLTHAESIESAAARDAVWA